MYLKRALGAMVGPKTTYLAPLYAKYSYRVLRDLGLPKVKNKSIANNLDHHRARWGAEFGEELIRATPTSTQWLEQEELHELSEAKCWADHVMSTLKEGAPDNQLHLTILGIERRGTNLMTSPHVVVMVRTSSEHTVARLVARLGTMGPKLPICSSVAARALCDNSWAVSLISAVPGAEGTAAVLYGGPPYHSAAVRWVHGGNVPDFRDSRDVYRSAQVPLIAPKHRANPSATLAILRSHYAQQR